MKYPHFQHIWQQAGVVIRRRDGDYLRWSQNFDISRDLRYVSCQSLAVYQGGYMRLGQPDRGYPTHIRLAQFGEQLIDIQTMTQNELASTGGLNCYVPEIAEVSKSVLTQGLGSDGVVIDWGTNRLYRLHRALEWHVLHGEHPRKTTPIELRVVNRKRAAELKRFLNPFVTAAEVALVTGATVQLDTNPKGKSLNAATCRDATAFLVLNAAVECFDKNLYDSHVDAMQDNFRKTSARLPDNAYLHLIALSGSDKPQFGKVRSNFVAETICHAMIKEAALAGRDLHVVDYLQVSR